MIKRPMIGMFLMTMIGICSFACWWMSIVAFLIGIGWYCYRLKRCTPLILMMVVLYLISTGRGWQYHRQYKAAQTILHRAEDRQQTLYVRGMLRQIQISETSVKYQLSHCKLILDYFSNTPCSDGESYQLPNMIVYQKPKDQSQGLQVGDMVIIKGIPTQLSSARNDGAYDEANVCYADGIVGKFLSPQIDIAAHTMPEMIRRRLFHRLETVKNHCAQYYDAWMKPENAALLKAMSLGDKSSIPREIKKSFSDSGISHVLAVSAVHVTLVGMFLYGMLIRLRVSRGVCSMLALFITALFIMLTGSSTSAIRAGIMFGILLLSMVVSRDYDALSAMSFAGIIIVMVHPFSMMSASFQYSFAAVTGIAVLQEWMHHHYRRIHPLLSGVTVAVTVWYVTMPLTAWYQYKITTVSFLLNLIIVPMVAPILLTGIAGGLLGSVLPGLSRILLAVSNGLLSLMTALAKRYQQLTIGSLVVGKPRLWMMIIFLILTFIVVVALYKGKKFLCTMLLTSGVALLVCGNLRSESQVVFLDVGQGDGIYIQTRAGEDIMIDGGSSSQSDVGEYVLLPFWQYHGRKKIDYWFVSHCDEDHISGLKQLLEGGYPISYLIFYKEVVKNQQYEQLLQLAQNNQTKVLYVEGAKKMQLQDIKIECVNLHDDQTEDINDRSLLLLVTFHKSGHRYFFGGDISASQEQMLIENEWFFRKCKNVYVYKCNHHGSKNSTSETFLKVLSPEHVVISCGKNNRYGHPHEELLERLYHIRCNVFQTQESGAIKMYAEGVEFYVK